MVPTDTTHLLHKIENENITFSVYRYDQAILHIEIKGSSSFASDRFRLKTIIRNIVSNAFKYNRDDVESWVKINVELDDAEAVIRIVDNGQGIRKTELEKVFGMFHRSNESSDGTGLGLYIVKELVDKLKGDIKLESEFGSGTSIELRIPNLLS